MTFRQISAIIIGVGLGLNSPVTWAQESQTVEEYVWGQLPTSAASEQTRTAKDLELRTSSTPSDVMRLVPGLIIGQHHGGGKADQIRITALIFKFPSTAYP
jgi:outer membrane receptor for Fe3+-dicitrate